VQIRAVENVKTAKLQRTPILQNSRHRAEGYAKNQ